MANAHFAVPENKKRALRNSQSQYLIGQGSGAGAQGLSVAVRVYGWFSVVESGLPAHTSSRTRGLLPEPSSPSIPRPQRPMKQLSPRTFAFVERRTSQRDPHIVWKLSTSRVRWTARELAPASSCARDLCWTMQSSVSFTDVRTLIPGTGTARSYTKSEYTQSLGDLIT